MAEKSSVPAVDCPVAFVEDAWEARAAGCLDCESRLEWSVFADRAWPVGLEWGELLELPAAGWAARVDRSPEGCAGCDLEERAPVELEPEDAGEEEP